MGVGGPFHQVVDALFLDFLEAQPKVKAHRWVVVLDVDPHQQASFLTFSQDFLHNRTAQPASAVLRQQSNIDQPDLVLSAIDVQTTNRLVIQQDEIKRRPWKMLQVVFVLGVELELQEVFFLLLRPRHRRHLFGTGRGVDLAQNEPIRIGDRLQSCRRNVRSCAHSERRLHRQARPVYVATGLT